MNFDYLQHFYGIYLIIRLTPKNIQNVAETSKKTYEIHSAVWIALLPLFLVSIKFRMLKIKLDPYTSFYI